MWPDHPEDGILITVAAQGGSQHAAVATRAGNGLNDLRLLGEPLRDRWQFALLRQRGKCRCFMVVGSQRRGSEDKGDPEGKRNPAHDVFLCGCFFAALTAVTAYRLDVYMFPCHMTTV